MKLRFIILTICSLFLNTNAIAYDCSSLSVTVKAGTPNNGVSEDSIFLYAFNSSSVDAQCGQFANGDYWVAPASGQTSVTITGITTTSAGSISADVDPVIESMGLLDGSNSYGNYNTSENIIQSLPITYSGVNSIVTAIQRNETIEGDCGTSGIVGECVDAYNILTILGEVPANDGSDMIRPNITGTSKEILTLTDFDLTRLPSKDYLVGTDAAGLEAIRLRWSHSTDIFALIPSDGVGFSEGGRAYRSHILIDDYGGGAARQYLDDLMTIFSSDNNPTEKQSALIAMITYGQDLYHGRFNGGLTRYWGTGATQHPGKFPPAVFFASLLNNSTKANVLKLENANRHNTIFYGPAELAQIHDGVDSRRLWGDDNSLTGIYYQGAYWDNLMQSQCYDNATGTCNPSIGSKTMLDPYGYIDGPPNQPGTSYMITSLGLQRGLLGVMYIMPEMSAIVNSEELEEYVLRVDTDGLVTADDECVAPDSREDFASCDPYRNTGCAYYGVTWGPVDPTDMESDCIKTATPPYTQVGRFTDLNGDSVTPSYTVGQVEANWDTIIGTTPTTHSVFTFGGGYQLMIRMVE